MTDVEGYGIRLHLLHQVLRPQKRDQYLFSVNLYYFCKIYVLNDSPLRAILEEEEILVITVDSEACITCVNTDSWTNNHGYHH